MPFLSTQKQNQIECESIDETKLNKSNDEKTHMCKRNLFLHILDRRLLRSISDQFIGSFFIQRAKFKHNTRMDMRIIFTICSLFVVLQISVYAAALEPIDARVADVQDGVLRTNIIMKSTKKDKTKLVQHKRDSCYNIFEWKCCCEVKGRRCHVHQKTEFWGKDPSCSRLSGRTRCGRCIIGWRC